MARSFLTPILLPAQASAPSAPASGFTLYANPSNALSWIGANGFRRVFDGTANTANRTYTLPNASGTIALTTVLTQTLTYAATINLDLAALTGTHQLLTLTGAVEFTTSNRVLGHWVTIFIDPGASNRTLTFPAGWNFYSAKPSTQTANKRAVLTLKANGTELSDIHAAWKEAP